MPAEATAKETIMTLPQREKYAAGDSACFRRGKRLCASFRRALPVGCCGLYHKRMSLFQTCSSMVGVPEFGSSAVSPARGTQASLSALPQAAWRFSGAATASF
jgi:hypothetical protein